MTSQNRHDQDSGRLLFSPEGAPATRHSLHELKPPFELVLTDLLLGLKPHQQITVDFRGIPITGGQIARGEGQATFRKTCDGDYLIRDGTPSKNGIEVCDTLGLPHVLENSLVIPEGTRIVFAKCIEMILPGNNPDTAPLEPALERVKAMKTGECCIIGRHPWFAQILLRNQHISRLHATLERLPDLTMEGNSLRCYRLSEGVRSPYGTFVQNEDGSWQELEGWTMLSTGRKIRFNCQEDTPSFQLPKPPEKTAKFPEYQPSALNGSLMSISQEGAGFAHSAESLSFRDPGKDRKFLAVKPAQAHQLGLHICNGLTLLREALSLYKAALFGDPADGLDDARRAQAERQCRIFREVMTHFSNMYVLQLCGFRYEEGNMFGLAGLTPDEVRETLTRIAMRSWYMPESRVVQPSYGDLPQGFDFNRASASEVALAREFMREVCLIYAEEWTHAYQHALGQNVSKKGAFFTGPDAHEHDVAQFLREQQIEMSPLYLSRYGREEALEQAKGIQSSAQQNAMAAALRALPPGKLMVFGRNGDFKINAPDLDEYLAEHPRMAQLMKADPGAYNRERVEKFLEKSYREISFRHMGVIKKAGGGYLIYYAPGADPRTCKIFAPDTYGIWRLMTTRSTTLPPGGKVRMGAHFQIELP